MSNPGVITLCNDFLENGNNIRIEDNIGESIHLHIGEIRIDFSINEFLDYEELFIEAINNLIDVRTFNIQDYDIKFLTSIAKSLLYLRSIEKGEIQISKLSVYYKKFGIPLIGKIDKSIMRMALDGNDCDYLSYKQENRFNESNIERLRSVEKYISANCYKEIDPIVLFNNQNIIRDGQHRSAIFHKKNYKYINYIRLNFESNNYNISNYPYINFFFKWNITRLKGIYRIIRINIRYFRKRIYFKVKSVRNNYFNI